MISTVLEAFVSLSCWLMVILGGLSVTCLLLYPIWFLVNNVLYQRTKASIYFISYIKNRKEFIKWHKENKPDVFTPKIDESKFK